MSQKDDVIRILRSAKGDDLYRAQAAFRYHTPEQMQQQYGQSGKTCAQIIQGYEAHNEHIDDLIRWVESV